MVINHHKNGQMQVVNMKLTDLFEDIRYEIKYYNKDGKRHRSDGPALIWADGEKERYINGKPHREDGPAIIYSNGYEAWYINGKCYGDGDKPPQEWLDAGGKYETD